MTLTQSAFPFSDLPMNPGADLTGYVEPDRSPPEDGRVSVTVFGTVRNERDSFLRSWEIWSKQEVPEWLDVTYLVVDDGSDEAFYDEVASVIGCRPGPPQGRAPVLRSRRGWSFLLWPLRTPETPARSCTIAFNYALRNLVSTPYVMFQWWDRIPGSFSHLRRLAEPHRTEGGIMTSNVARHIGGSSSMVDMTPDELAARMAMVPWSEKPQTLSRISGQIGSHCRPGNASESAGLFLRTDELLAVGGWDERYTTQHSYVNVDLFRRLFATGLRCEFVPEPHGACYHQSHGSYRERSTKPMDLMADPVVVRNDGPDGEWGRG